MSARSLPLAVLALYSCSLVTEVDVPAVEPRIVVNGLFHPDSTWSIIVSQNRHILAPELPPPPANAIATITDEFGFVTTLTPTLRDQYLDFESPSAPVGGRSYTIRVSAPGFPDATATAAAPAFVELVEVYLDSSKMIPRSDYSTGSIPIEFTFQDPTGQKDYYIPKFYVAREYRRYNWPDTTYVIETSWEDAYLSYVPAASGLSESEQPISVLDDEGFDGELHTIRLHVNRTTWSSNDPPTLPWKFQLTHAGEDYEKYRHSYQVQRETHGNPLAQPVQVYTNIQGGLGIFAGSTTSTWSQD